MSLQEGSKIPPANALQALLLKYWGHKVKCKSILDSPENNSTLLYSTLPAAVSLAPFHSRHCCGLNAPAPDPSCLLCRHVRLVISACCDTRRSNKQHCDTDSCAFPGVISVCTFEELTVIWIQLSMCRQYKSN